MNIESEGATSAMASNLVMEREKEPSEQEPVVTLPARFDRVGRELRSGGRTFRVLVEARNGTVEQSNKIQSRIRESGACCQPMMMIGLYFRRWMPSSVSFLVGRLCVHARAGGLFVFQFSRAFPLARACALQMRTNQPTGRQRKEVTGGKLIERGRGGKGRVSWRGGGEEEECRELRKEEREATGDSRWQAGTVGWTAAKMAGDKPQPEQATPAASAFRATASLLLRASRASGSSRRGLGSFHPISVGLSVHSVQHASQ
ncbi:uncharacterized protein F5Z01DRAFT_552144 [Emericellopsis atlantica]|uniref:Uncharacterized protein n=1 Tax=Emericellopsis atlantica TaxID=2614577 RepID=A0A9P7ZQ01_9HYPO|nr:uncharacterized protein F5Z01DRAFT_552144 [Emericellopsis atlantica]KAG9255677.1 hypothetical protein F5Z01DRAFT_552144 [Emericellopsis atlantica]